jgi:hypothetical protein
MVEAAILEYSMGMFLVSNRQVYYLDSEKFEDCHQTDYPTGNFFLDTRVKAE